MHSRNRVSEPMEGAICVSDEVKFRNFKRRHIKGRVDR